MLGVWEQMKSVFPARAGMSRTNGYFKTHRPRVPRASGDEPGRTEQGASPAVCSPRERG